MPIFEIQESATGLIHRIEAEDEADLQKMLCQKYSMDICKNIMRWDGIHYLEFYKKENETTNWHYTHPDKIVDFHVCAINIEDITCEPFNWSNV